MIPRIGALGRCHSPKISAQLLSLLGPRLCSARLGATIVRFTMPRRAPARFPLLLLALSLLAPVPAAAQAQNNFTYGPLPVFELHSGFWINLHHTLYHEARLRTTAGSHDKSGKTSGPALNTAPDAKPALTSAEQHIWDDAIAYYVANYAAKDLLFSTELIQLKDQLGDFEDCDELSGRKRKFCDAGLPTKLTQVLEAAGPVYRAHLWPEHDRANPRWIMRVAPPLREQGVAPARPGRGPFGTACAHFPDALATRKNPRRPHGLRQLDRCLHHRRSLASHHLQPGFTQSGRRCARSPFPRKFARYRRARAGRHHPRVPPAR